MKKIFILLIASLALVWGVKGQIYADPDVVSLGVKLPARSYIVPFANEAQLKSRTSSLVIKVSEWTKNGDTYTATFKRPSDWDSRAIIVRITGAAHSFAIKVNDTEVGYSQWGRGRAEFDVTNSVKEFYNTLTITLFPTSVAEQIDIRQPDKSADIGSVEVVSQYSVRVEDMIVEARSNGESGLFSLRLAMHSTILNNRNLTLQYELNSPDGKVVAKEERQVNFIAGRADTISFRFVNLDKIEAWTADSPKLYSLTIRTLYNTRPVEVISRQVGFTDFSFSEDGQFMVNGEIVPLIAVEMEWMGSAEATEKQMKRAKSNNANAILVGGEPQIDEFYAIADRVGMYVIDHADIATGLQYPNVSNDPDFADAFTERVLATYHYSRIHPSVIAYISADNTALGYNISESYVAYKNIEKRRPLIFIGSNGHWASDSISISISDI